MYMCLFQSSGFWLPQDMPLHLTRTSYSLFCNPVGSEPLCDRPNSCEEAICRRIGFRSWLLGVVLFLCLQGPNADHALRINMLIVARFVDISEIGGTLVVQDEHKVVEGVRGRATQFVQRPDYLVLAEWLQIGRVFLENYSATKTLITFCTQKTGIRMATQKETNL